MSNVAEMKVNTYPLELPSTPDNYTFLVLSVTTQSMSADICHERTRAISGSETSAK